MPSRKNLVDFKPSSRVLLEATSLVKRLEEQNIWLKDLLLTLLVGKDNEDEVSTARRYWGSEQGWPSTKNVLMAIQKLIKKSPEGRANWNRWIYFEASRIVAAEGSRRKRHLMGEITTAKAISHSFFDIENSADRSSALRKGMGFLWHLIRGAITRRRQLDLRDDPGYLSEELKAAAAKRKSKVLATPATVVEPPSETSLTEIKDMIQDEDMVQDEPVAILEANSTTAPTELSFSSDSSAFSNWSTTTASDDGKVDVVVEDEPMNAGEVGEGSDWANEEEGVVYVGTVDRKESWRARVTTVTNTVCAMIAFVSNRTINGLALENSLTFLASGVSERMNNYLNYVGLTASRRTALRMAATLTAVSMGILRDRLALNYIIRPFLTLDNFDIMERIHYSRLDAASRMFHGTWGYFHFISDALLAQIDPKDLSLDSFITSMKNAESTHVEARFFLSDDKGLQHWNEVSKCQLNQAYIDYAITKNNSCEPKSVPTLQRNPPPIDPITPTEPDVLMLKLMDAPDGSAGGIGQVLEQVAKQSGRSVKDHPNDLQIIEGDVGTCLNIESLRRKRAPSNRRHESLGNYLSIPGAAHTMWNTAQALIADGWGNPDCVEDTGYGAMWEMLSGKAVKPVVKKDFGVIMRMIFHIHSALLVYCLREVTKKMKKDDPHLDLENTKTAKAIIEATHAEFLSASSLREAKKAGDIQGYNLRLQIRDLSTFVEANQATKQGDIGRLILMRKRWSIMAHGMSGLSHYKMHIPRLILLLEKYLPTGLAHLLKHSMLLATRGRAGHFVPKDLFLEFQNWWLNFFFNRSGSGTRIRVLAERYSANIKLLRWLIVNLRIRSGMVEVFRNKKNLITTRSLDKFLAWAERNLSKTIGVEPIENDDYMQTGFLKLQKILLKEVVHHGRTRYRWGNPEASEKDTNKDDVESGAEADADDSNDSDESTDESTDEESNTSMYGMYEF